ncbi:MAG: DUF4124 domain-containing protein, partial [Pseudomonadota bacterium]|nr:DUF4124 domain-containing protein [Pseudomonadota bacterium]
MDAVKRIGLTALLAVLAATAADARRLYKYQDEHGNWHYSDRPPASGRPAEVRQLPVTELPYRVSLRNAGSGAEPVLSVVNGYYGPVEVEIDLPKRTNIA